MNEFITQNQGVVLGAIIGFIASVFGFFVKEIIQYRKNKLRDKRQLKAVLDLCGVFFSNNDIEKCKEMILDAMQLSYRLNNKNNDLDKLLVTVFNHVKNANSSASDNFNRLLKEIRERT